MRVTQSMLSNNMLRNLSNSYSRLDKLQDQISTQKKFTKPSDDPVAAMMGMNYRTDLNRIQQFTRNIGEVRNWVDSTDDALDKGVLALQRIRELTLQASNGTLEEDQRKAVAEEVKQLKEHLQNIGDTQVGGKYIFNGNQTNVRPSESGFQSGTIELEVFSGIKIPVNTEGKALFGDMLSDEGDIQKLITALETNDPAVGEMLENVDKNIDNFLSARALIGAKQNRVELMEDRLSQQEVFSTRILSDNEDIDMEKAIIELTTQESIHRAALSVGARIIQPSLTDFLR
ncbi:MULTISPECIES: flagellar hook-associated protein FlgL [Cytobacillus]|uniref:Flagellar biosynthesis protein FlgL n=1 Tax=Cytobacillus oceanisediminis 2691 TaxID=1196031 RepID=A0A169FZN7_9BACI|nr:MULTISPECIES: flagellar hook-associated protein FlgL [Cytobacillus]AND42225.1 flagellar biosynthesis protein FlgL [Cytobacillus oceanisediminis 2691]MCM3391456.1 flagellar hook-associated protein FlgL [Cytobacillus oceanisediminis]MCS0673406.1 flagellar hook-associated protein FlgL [Cytobacillus firmus]UQX53827.1 flagellar hook-associated protein FlgL [Cytobacillus pseudoceanisediminis]